jgi:hypothetical protein
MPHGYLLLASAANPSTPYFISRTTRTRRFAVVTGLIAGGDKSAGKAPKIRMPSCRDDAHTRKPAISGHFAMNREISVCVRLRGGAGRTRTSNQTIIRR